MRVHHLKLKSRAVFSVVIAALVNLLLPAELRWSMRMLCVWDAGMLCFLGLTGMMIAQATPDSMRRYAQAEEEGRLFILGTIIVSACSSLFAIGFLLKDSQALTPIGTIVHIVLAIVTILSSWLLIHTIFTLQYAHLYYQPGASPADNQAAGLDFPHTVEPDYWDFLYFSFVIGMTSQVSDVSISSRTIRRLSLLHGILSFFFNTSLLALSINILSGLL